MDAFQHQLIHSYGSFSPDAALVIGVEPPICRPNQYKVELACNRSTRKTLLLPCLCRGFLFHSSWRLPGGAFCLEVQSSGPLRNTTAGRKLVDHIRTAAHGLLGSRPERVYLQMKLASVRQTSNIQTSWARARIAHCPEASFNPMK